MKGTTITLPDDLAEAVENYVQSHEAPPLLTTVVQAALRQYLGERGFLRSRKALQVTASKRGSEHTDVSRDHDLYLSGLRK